MHKFVVVVVAAVVNIFAAKVDGVVVVAVVVAKIAESNINGCGVFS